MGIQVYQSSSQEDLDQWFRVLMRLYRDKHRMITQPKSLFQRLFDCPEFTKLFIAKKEDKVIGGILILFDSNRWDYCWGAVVPEFTKFGVSSLIINEAIVGAIEAGASTFGFGSSSPTDKNLLEFKSKWGCDEISMFYHYWNHRPNNIDLSNDFQLIRNAFPYIPLLLKNFKICSSSQQTFIGKILDQFFQKLGYSFSK